MFAPVVVSLRLGRDRLTVPVGYRRRSLPVPGLLLLADVVGVDAPVSGKLSVYLRPLLIDRPVLIVPELSLPPVDLASVDVDVDVGMLGIRWMAASAIALGKVCSKSSLASSRIWVFVAGTSKDRIIL